MSPLRTTAVVGNIAKRASPPDGYGQEQAFDCGNESNLRARIRNGGRTTRSALGGLPAMSPIGHDNAYFRFS